MYTKKYKILLNSSKSKLRIYNLGRIENVPEDYYDQLIIAQSTNKFIPVLKIIGIVLGKSNQLIGDIFKTYRLKHLIEKKKLDYKGNLNDIKNLLVKT